MSAVDSAHFDYGGGVGGYIDLLGYTFCRGRILDHREEDMGQYETQRPLFWACGSALFLRLDAAREINFLDKEFFMHFEEIDLCWRAQGLSVESYYCAKSTIYHYGGGTLQINNPMKNYYNHRNNLLLILKNMSLKLLAVTLPFGVCFLNSSRIKANLPLPWSC